VESGGGVGMVVVVCGPPDRIRGCATFDPASVNAAIDAGEASTGALMGRGQLDMTIDQGPDMRRYQGVVALDGGSLEEAAHEYFRRSEQIPTRVRLAVAEEFRSGDDGVRRHWRAGGRLARV